MQKVKARATNRDILIHTFSTFEAKNANRCIRIQQTIFVTTAFI